MTIRVEIEAVAPAINGADGRTLSDLHDVLSALLTAPGSQDQLAALALIAERIDYQTTNDNANRAAIITKLATWDLNISRLSNIATGINSIVSRLDTSNTRLLSIDAKLDALADMDTGISDINAALVPLVSIDSEIALISDQIENVNTSILSGNSLIGDVNTSVGGLSSSIGDIETAVLSGNTISTSMDGKLSLLSDININIGSGNTLTSDVTAAINATSGSIRGEIVALTAQDATNHGASMAQLITIADQVGLGREATEAASVAIVAAVDASGTAIVAAIDASETAIVAAVEAQTTAIDALFDEHIGESYSGGDPNPIAVNEWLQRLDDKISVIAAEYGWGQ